MADDRQFVLNFHGVGTPHAGVDASEQPYWISERFFTDIVGLVAARPDADRVVWTFDDGNRSDLAFAAPLLAQHGFRGAFFLLTGRFEDPHYLSRDDARSLLAMNMAVGLHGRDHVNWAELPEATLSAETTDARSDLGKAVGRDIDTVAIPFGAYNRNVIARLKREGFKRIYTTDKGWSRAGDRVCNRTSVRSDMSLAQIAGMLDGREPLKSKFRRALSTTYRRHFK